MTFDSTSVEVLCVTLRKDHCVQVPWKYIKVCGYSDPFCKNLNQRSLTPRWSLTPHLSCVTLPKDQSRGLAEQGQEEEEEKWATLGVHPLSWLLSNNRLEEVCGTLTKGTFSSRLLLSNQDKGCTPSVAHSLPLPLPLPPSFCSTCLLCPSPMGIHQCMWIQWSILQMTNQRSMTPRLPLTPHLLRSHVWLYPRIIVSKSHENTSKYVDTVTFFAKNLNQVVIDP